jgi:hypothetical protein
MYLGEMLVLPLVASRCTLFLEEREGRREDAGLPEVDGDKTLAAVGEGRDGATSGCGGRTSPSRISAGHARGGDGGAAAVDRVIRNSEQVLQERGAREEEVGTRLWLRRSRERGEGRGSLPLLHCRWASSGTPHRAAPTSPTSPPNPCSSSAPPPAGGSRAVVPPRSKGGEGRTALGGKRLAGGTLGTRKGAAVVDACRSGSSCTPSRQIHSSTGDFATTSPRAV